MGGGRGWRRSKAQVWFGVGQVLVAFHFLGESPGGGERNDK